MINLMLQRLISNGDTTVGLLAVESLRCFSVEDEHRDIKVYGETRIPAGRYEIKLRKEGGFHKRYTNKYGSRHKGMLHLQDVPNFTWVYIHPGNTDDDTLGCILPNLIFSFGTWTGSSSVKAYWLIYDYIATALEQGEKVYIDVIDEL